MPLRLKPSEARKLGVPVPIWEPPLERPRKPRKPRGAKTGSVSAPRLFVAACKAHGLPEPVPEYRFLKDRKFRWDWAWPRFGVAVEIQGGIWVQGKHSRGAGQLRDFEKWNLAQKAGWHVFLATPQQVSDGSLFEFLRDVFAPFA